MEQTRHYSRSPIVEARIDIKVQCSPEMEVANLMQVATAIESDYEIREQLGNRHAKITIDNSSNDVVSSSVTDIQVGYRFVSNNKQTAIQARLDGFTFSHFIPYPGWDIFREKAFNLWNIYRQVINPISINSLAVRYVNRIDIPSAEIELKDYFKTVPEISPDLPEALRSYIMYLQIPIKKINSTVHITQTSIPSPSPDLVSIALDIHIIKEGMISQETEDILATLDLIHTQADRVFEASITDTTRGLIE
jgi:uncharacterized protein (TIGR04255 family)